MRRALHIIMALLVVVLVVGLYKAKTDAAQTEAHVRQLQHQIADEESDQRALKAEIAHLESPQNVQQLAQSHLELTPAQQGQALPTSQIDQRLPAPRRMQSASAHP
jgi:cell division protein FtsL